MTTGGTVRRRADDPTTPDEVEHTMAHGLRAPRAGRKRGDAPSAWTGALAGAFTALAFAAVHALWISDIWFNTVPMLLAGALCGGCIVWSYRRATSRHTWPRWWGYNAGCAGLLVALGAASFLVLEPRFTMAELMAADDALAQLLPPAMPLVIAGTAVGTVALWTASGRRHTAAVPILLAQALLMFLVGHNLAILGLVEIPTDQRYRVAGFVGVTVFLAATFAAAVRLAARVRVSRSCEERLSGGPGGRLDQGAPDH